MNFIEELQTSSFGFERRSLGNSLVTPLGRNRCGRDESLVVEVATTHPEEWQRFIVTCSIEDDGKLIRREVHRGTHEFLRGPIYKFLAKQ